MGFFFLASISGLFPDLSLPVGLGWKEIHAFDLAFAACMVFAAAKGAVRSPDWRLIAACAAFLGAATLALWAHPSPEGVRAVVSLTYSAAVLLVVAHLRVNALGIRVDRAILWPLFVAIAIAGVVFVIENGLAVTIAGNSPRSLPAGVHRLGGFTGANALVLFMCLAAPLPRSPPFIFLAILLPAFATLSRSLLGVGVALIVNAGGGEGTKERARRGMLGMSWLAVALGLFAYAFAVVPVTTLERRAFHLSLDSGGYLTLHQAALRMLSANPVVGVGPDQFVKEYRRFTSTEERQRVFEVDAAGWAPHSALLGLAAEQGTLSLVAFAWLMYEIFKRLGRIRDPEFRLAAIAGLTGLLVGGHFVDWLALKGLWFWIGLLVAASFDNASPFDDAHRPRHAEP